MFVKKLCWNVQVHVSVVLEAFGAGFGRLSGRGVTRSLT